jgi:hypothetical protein
VLYFDKGINTVTDFITKLMRPTIEANKRLEPVNIHANGELATKLGPWRTAALKFVGVPDANSPYPGTVECRIKEKVIGSGRYLIFKDARLRAATLLKRLIDALWTNLSH